MNQVRENKHSDNSPKESLQEPLILSELSDNVLWLTLNRPKSRNTLSLAMIDELHQQIINANTNEEVRVVVLSALGPVFSAGHDLNEMRSDEREVLTRCSAMMMAIVASEKSVIACVSGIATAGGCQLVAACDLAIAANTAKFCTPGVNIGGFCTTPLVAIGRKIHRKHAMEMALTGDMFSADEAMRFGLVNRVYDEDEVRQEVRVLAKKIASKSAIAIAHGKKAFYQQMDMPLEEAYHFATEKMIESNRTEDSKEGTQAFLEKRKPHWKNK